MNLTRSSRLVWLGLFLVFTSAPVVGAERQKSGTNGDNKGISPKRASLGVVIRKPTSEEIASFSLAGSKRHPEGQLVTKVVKKSAADHAGIRVGDMLIALNKNRIYSTDDLEDFLSVSKPSTKIDVIVKLAKSYKEKTLSATLDTSDKDIQTKGLQWEFASMGQLDEALAAASKSGKLLLVGLSGADT